MELLRDLLRDARITINRAQGKLVIVIEGLAASLAAAILAAALLRLSGLG